MRGERSGMAGIARDRSTPSILTPHPALRATLSPLSRGEGSFAVDRG